MQNIFLLDIGTEKWVVCELLLCNTPLALTVLSFQHGFSSCSKYCTASHTQLFSEGVWWPLVTASYTRIAPLLQMARKWDCYAYGMTAICAFCAMLKANEAFLTGHFCWNICVLHIPETSKTAFLKKKLGKNSTQMWMHAMQCVHTWLLWCTISVCIYLHRATKMVFAYWIIQIGLR